MIRHRNEALKHLDDLMLHRWENEGGCLGPLTMTDRDSHCDDYSRAASEAALNVTHGRQSATESGGSVLSRSRPSGDGYVARIRGPLTLVTSRNCWQSH
jgi:hypothetical protein